MNSEELKKLRNEMGLTQGQLARKLDASVTTISRWEMGENSPMPFFEKKFWKIYNKWQRGQNNLMTEQKLVTPYSKDRQVKGNENR